MRGLVHQLRHNFLDKVREVIKILFDSMTSLMETPQFKVNLDAFLTFSL